MAVFLKHVNYVEILEINCKYQLNYRIEKYQYHLKSLISFQIFQYRPSLPNREKCDSTGPCKNCWHVNASLCLKQVIRVLLSSYIVTHNGIDCGFKFIILFSLYIIYNYCVRRLTITY